MPWTYLRAVPVPFGELAWEHARKVADRDRAGQATEQEIAASVSALLDKAGRGPGTPGWPAAAGRRGQKVAARTRAVPRAGDGPQPGPAPAAQLAEAGRELPAAEIVPLPVFDPLTEARKRW